ncbi:tail completion protein gp17 [Sphingomonas pseudosanguinis]|uniref:tail completion protein gp17 n=1 Tax=Sphingomonas pseudosanguinis TaxID=413712 RepID=UPI003F83115B
MTLEDAIETRLLAFDNLTARIADRVGWTRRLAGIPAITLQVISDQRPQHFKGFQPIRPTLVQLDVWSADPREAAAIRDLCIAALVPAETVGDVQFQRAMIASVRSGAEPDRSGDSHSYAGELHRESIDFSFLHNA